MNETEQLKKKFPLHIQNSLLEQVEKLEDDAHVKSKNAFIIKAVEFYIGYLNQQKSLDFISPVLASAIKSEIKSVEKNMCEMLYKIAVEMGVNSNLLALTYNLNSESVDDLRNQCADAIAKNNGIIKFEDAVRHQIYGGKLEKEKYYYSDYDCGDDY